jgi:hypothetical protein
MDCILSELPKATTCFLLREYTPWHSLTTFPGDIEIGHIVSSSWYIPPKEVFDLIVWHASGTGK